jgi:catechol 2,3-dioxygenase-like lactoylglutathione lyase family enzyme
MRLNCIILPVGTPDDLAAARRWYEELLGLHVNSVVEDHSVWLDLGSGTELGLHVGEPVGAPEHLTVGLHVDDLDQVYEELCARGVVFDGPPEDREWGRRAATTDPTGHTVYIMNP